MEELKSKVEYLKNKLDKHRPLNSNLVKRLRDRYILEFTHNSTAIEGNTLSLIETKVLLEDGITIGGKRYIEHAEIVNHKIAIEKSYDYVANRVDLSETLIKDINETAMKHSEFSTGMYRDHEVIITGATHTPPNHIFVRQEMGNLIHWYDYSKEQNSDSIEISAIFHSKFVNIHPFADGNGRTARILLNMILIKNGYPPIIIRKEDRNTYYSSLDKAGSQGDFKPFVEFVYNNLISEMKMYLKLLEPKLHITENIDE